MSTESLARFPIGNMILGHMNGENDGQDCKREEAREHCSNRQDVSGTQRRAVRRDGRFEARKDDCDRCECDGKAGRHCGGDGRDGAFREQGYEGSASPGGCCSGSSDSARIGVDGEREAVECSLPSNACRCCGRYKYLYPGDRLANILEKASWQSTDWSKELCYVCIARIFDEDPSLPSDDEIACFVAKHFLIMARSYKRRLPVQQCEDGYWSSGPCHLYKRGTFGLADTKKDGHWYCDVCLRNPHRDERGRFTARTPYKRLYYPAETHDLKEIYDLAGASRSHLDPSHQNGIANQNYLTARIRHLRKKAGIKGSVCDREFFREPFKKSYAYRFSILDNPQYCSRFLLYKGRMDFWEQSKYRF